MLAALPKNTESVRNSEVRVLCSRQMKSQCAWWIRNICLHSSKPASLPHAKQLCPMPSVELYPDAAGVSKDNLRLGCGALVDILPPILCYMMWPPFIQENRVVEGGRVGDKLSFLEGIAALCAVIAEPELMFSRVVGVNSDNLGLVLAWRKGSSRCLLTYSVILALKTLERAFNMKIVMKKVPRCSSPQTQVADALSKGLVKEMHDLFPHRRLTPPRFSSTLVSWLNNPFPTRTLGMAIVAELSRDYKLADAEIEWEDDFLHLVRFNRM